MTKGTVTKVHKNGRFYSMVVDNKWYGLGSNQPEFAEGAMVEFDVTQNGDFFNAKNVNVLGKAPATAKPQATSGRVVHNTEKDDYWRNKELRDVQNDKAREIGAGRNTAIAFVDLLLKSNSLPLPKTASKQADVIFEAVEYYRAKFAAAESGAVAAAPANEAPEEETDGDDDYE